MKTIAIGIVAFALAHGSAAAQTAAEQARILQDFQVSVADYMQHEQRADLSPKAQVLARPAPRIFTLPVAMVFRQAIAKALAHPSGVGVSSGGKATYLHPEPLGPFPSTWLGTFPHALQEALPPLPTPLEYRLVGHDLVIRDTAADIVVGVLRNAVGSGLTNIQ